MSTLNEKIENLEQVTETKDPIETVGTMDHVMADAYIESEKVDKHLQEVTTELNNKADQVILDSPTDNAEEMPKNMYTENKLKLEEEFSDFVLKEESPKLKDGRSHRQSTRDENDGDKFLDYDMFTFIHELFAGQNCNTNPCPMTPVIYGKIVNRKTKEVTYGMRPMRKFMDSGVENRKVGIDERNFGVPQVGIDGNNIIISAAEQEDLNDVIEACKIFKFNYGNIQSQPRNNYWPWRISVQVPLDHKGAPMMLEDYLVSIGKTVEDVMYPDFAKGYRNSKAKIEKAHAKDSAAVDKAVVAMSKKVDSTSIDDLLNNDKFNDLFNKAVVIAANDDSPLIDHAKQLVKDCQNAGLTFKRQDVIDLFMSEFDDTYLEDEN